MNNSSMTSKLFFKLLPVQILIVAMGSINSMIDGVVAGRFIAAESVGVIGLFMGIVSTLNAISSVFLGGSSVISGRYMGSGDLEKTRGIFSLNVTLTIMVGAISTAVGILFPGYIADICGSNAELKGELMTYIVGYSLGILPMMLSQQLVAFLQLERQSRRNYIGIGAMIVFNIAFDIVFVSYFNMGVWGLALSTSFCNWIYFIILVTYYFFGKPQLYYEFKKILWKDTWNLIKIGSPGALLVFCLGLRDFVLNRIILTYAGEAGLAAKSALGMIGGFFIAFCLGAGAVVRMLASINIGEEDKDAIKELIKVCFTKGLVLTVVITVVVLATSKLFVGIFFPDSTTLVYHYALQYFILYDISIPLILIVLVESNYLQAMEQNACVNIFSMIDGFFSVVVPAAILAPLFGPMGIWLATPIGIVISSIVYPINAIVFWKRIPKTWDEWLLFKKDFGVEDNNRLVMTIENTEDVSNTSVAVQGFCDEHGMDRKKAMYSALCLEEMTRNVIEHGFTHDSKKHYLEARVVFKDDEAVLRIKDDCISFDPVDMSSHMNSEDVTKNIGIKMVMRLADSANYQSLLGLNVLTIKLHK